MKRASKNVSPEMLGGCKGGKKNKCKGTLPPERGHLLCLLKTPRFLHLNGLFRCLNSGFKFRLYIQSLGGGGAPISEIKFRL